MGFSFIGQQNPSSGLSPWGSASGELFHNLTDPRPGIAQSVSNGEGGASSPAPGSNTSRAWTRAPQGERTRGDAVIVEESTPAIHPWGLRTQEDLSGVSEPAQPAQAERHMLASHRGERAAEARGDEWAARAQSLLGQWVRTKTAAHGLDPDKKGADGAWARDGSVVPKGTALRVAGAVLSDGALLCHWPQLGRPGTAVQYRPLWLHHHQVELTSEPKEVREASEGERLAAKQDEEARQASEQREGAARHLGTVRQFDEGFYASVGGVLDALVPNQGDQGKVLIEANIPVAGSHKAAGVCLSLRLSFEAEREEEGVRARVEVGVGVLAQVRSVIVDAFVQAMLFGYLEAFGDSGAEVMRLLSLAMCKTVQAQGRIGRKAAAMVWGKNFEAGVAQQMDDDDFVETGLGLELSASFEQNDRFTDKERSGELTYRKSRGTRYENPDGGTEVEARKVETTELSIALDIFDDWSGSLSVIWGADGLDIEVELTREAELSTKGEFLSESNIHEVLIHWTGTAFGQVHGLLRGQSGQQCQALARQVGAAISNIQNIGLGPAFTEGALVHALAKRIDALKGLKLSQQLLIGLEIERGMGQISAELNSLRTIEVGKPRPSKTLTNDEPRTKDLVHVLLESTTRIAKVESGSFPIDPAAAARKDAP